MIIELYRKTLNEKYNGDKEAMIKDGYFIAWTQERIIGAFNNGKGTEEHLKRCMEANKKYCIYIDV